MKLKKFKEKDNKRIGIIVFTLVCVLLVSGVILYRTFAIFDVRTNQNVIKGTVQDPGNLYFAFYQKNDESGEYVIQKDMPNLRDGYVLDEVQSYCGVSGEKDPSIEVYLSEDGYIKVKGMKTSRTKCNLYFAKGIFIKGKGIPIVTSGDGLYLVEHPTTETEGMDDGWQKEEYRYAGVNPNNYVNFNDELWRIIGLVNVKVDKGDENEGIEQRLKIIRNDAIGDFSWHKEFGNNNWTTSSLMTMLNSDYYNSINGQNNCYRGPDTADDCDFSQGSMKGLDENARTLIDENIIWNIGGTDTYLIDSVSDWYNTERGKKTFNDQPYEWKKSNTTGEFHGIGLLYSSDYGYATIGSNDGKTRSNCINEITLVSYGESRCSTKDWLKPNYGYEWTITHDNLNNYMIIGISEGGFANSNYNNKLSERVFPSLYLKQNVYIISGTGAADDMFQLELK